MNIHLNTYCSFVYLFCFPFKTQQPDWYHRYHISKSCYHSANTECFPGPDTVLGPDNSAVSESAILLLWTLVQEWKDRIQNKLMSNMISGKFHEENNVE